jgi:hypothetical protein
MPAFGRDLLSRISLTVVRERIVSPADDAHRVPRSKQAI